MLERVQKKENPCTLLVGHKLVHPLWRILGKCLKKLKIQLSCDPAIILLDIYPEKNSNSKRYIHLSVHHSTIYNSQNMEAA